MLFWQYNLENTTERLHSKMEVLDIAQIVLKSMTEGK